MLNRRTHTLSTGPLFRWCEAQEKYLPTAACKKKGGTSPKCRRCFRRWQYWRSQLPLPLSLAGSGKR